MHPLLRSLMAIIIACLCGCDSNPDSDPNLWQNAIIAQFLSEQNAIQPLTISPITGSSELYAATFSLTNTTQDEIDVAIPRQWFEGQFRGASRDVTQTLLYPGLGFVGVVKDTITFSPGQTRDITEVFSIQTDDFSYLELSSSTPGLTLSHNFYRLNIGNPVPDPAIENIMLQRIGENHFQVELRITNISPDPIEVPTPRRWVQGSVRDSEGNISQSGLYPLEIPLIFSSQRFEPGETLTIVDVFTITTSEISTIEMHCPVEGLTLAAPRFRATIVEEDHGVASSHNG